MTRGGILVLGAAAATVAILLAGCATGSASPGATDPGTAATTASTPTPASTPKPEADPSQVRVPFDCDALYTEATAKTLVGTTVKASGGRTAPTNDIRAVAERQAGAMICTWGGGHQTEFGPTAYLSIAIAPEAASSYDSNLAANQPAKNHPVANTAGDKSSYYCKNGGVDSSGYSCSGELVVGDYWASISMTHLLPVTPAAMAKNVQQAMDKTAATLASAPPITLPAWPVPAGPAKAFCSDQTTAKVRTAMGQPTLTRYKSTSSIAITAATIGLANGVYADCFWTGPKEPALDFSILDGGSWAFPGITPAIPVDSVNYGARFMSWTVPGASTALVACNKNSCEAFLAVRHAAVQIDLNGSSRADVAAKLAKLVAIIKSTS